MDEKCSFGLGIFANSLFGGVLGLGLKGWGVEVEMRVLRWLNTELKSVRVCEVCEFGERRMRALRVEVSIGGGCCLNWLQRCWHDGLRGD